MYCLTIKANGLVERFKQSKECLCNLLLKKETWEDYLDMCIYAYNTSRHVSSLFTPFEVMFGQKAILPIDLSSGSSGADAVELIENDQVMRKRLQISGC